MVNKLRGLTLTGGGLLVVLSLWALSYYSVPRSEALPYVKVTATGVGIVILPTALAYVKLWVKTAGQYLERRKSDTYERGTIFISEDSVSDPEVTLDKIASAVSDVDDFDDVYRDAFPEGEGLTVIHTGFHNSFVRVSDSTRLVITGASAKSAALADVIAERVGLPLRRALRNPFVDPQPVRGAPRVLLGVVVVAIVVLGVVGIGGAAYPSPAYNPAEKTVLVGIDARAAIDPGVGETDHRLDKAAFLVMVLEEKQVEILWAQNDSSYIREHGEDAGVISRDVRVLLRQARASSPTPDQAERADRIESDLHAAELDIAGALDRRGASGNYGPDPFISLADEMRTAANTSVGEVSGTPTNRSR